MFSLVALMCLYLGIQNISYSVKVPLSSWQVLQWGLFATGVILLVICYFCIKQAINDYKQAKANTASNQSKSISDTDGDIYIEEDDENV